VAATAPPPTAPPGSPSPSGGAPEENLFRKSFTTGDASKGSPPSPGTAVRSDFQYILCHDHTTELKHFFFTGV